MAIDVLRKAALPRKKQVPPPSAALLEEIHVQSVHIDRLEAKIAYATHHFKRRGLRHLALEMATLDIWTGPPEPPSPPTVPRVIIPRRK